MRECFLSYNITDFACFWWMKCFINLFCMVYLCSSVLVLSDEAVVLYHGDRPAETGGRPGPRGSVPYHHWWGPWEIRGKVYFFVLNNNILLTAPMKIYQYLYIQWKIFQLILNNLSDFVGIRNWCLFGNSLLFNVWFNACLQDFEFKMYWIIMLLYRVVKYYLFKRKPT